MDTRRLRVMMNVEMRYFTPSALVDVLDISKRVCRNHWREQDFRIAMSTRNVTCHVAVRGHRILGYVMCQAHKESIEILDISVHPEFQRHWVGTQILDYVFRKLHPARRKVAFLKVSEHNLGLQLFLRDRGCRATAVYRDEFGKDDDAYVFEKGVAVDNRLDETTVPGQVAAR